jgi:hypothetical protein
MTSVVIAAGCFTLGVLAAIAGCAFIVFRAALGVRW